MMAIYNVHVFINPFAGRDAEFNAWYDAEHVPDVLALPGFLRAERFAVHPLGDEPMRYLTVYEVEAESPEDVLARIRAGQPSFRPSDSVDFSTAVIVAVAPLGPVVEAVAS
jgi:hypothetical protein